MRSMSPSTLLKGWIVMLTISQADVCSQVNYYTFTQSNSPYTEITGGVILGNNANSGYGAFMDPESSAFSNETTGAGFDIGFDFNYRGVMYDRFGVANNGWIFLGQSIHDTLAVDIGQFTGLPPMQDPGPANDTLRSRIIGFNTELQGNGTTSSLMYKLEGTAPERILVVQWKSYSIYSHFFFPNSAVNFQIRLHEADNTIDIHFGDVAFEGITGFTAQAGLSGFSFLEHHARRTEAPHDWNNTFSASTHLDVGSIDETTTPPTNGLLFTYTPASCVPPTEITLYDFSTSSLHFTWTQPYTDPGEGYEYALTESASPPVSGALISEDSIQVTGLQAGTSYYLHIRSLCSMADQSVWHTIQATTLCHPVDLPYTERFDAVVAPELPPCTRILNPDRETNPLITTADNYFSSPQSLGYPCVNYAPEDDWFFTPGFEVDDDSTYLVSVECISGDSVFVYAGNHPAIASMTILDTFIFSNGFSPGFTEFIAVASDTLFIGFQFKNCITRLDDIHIRKYDCRIPANIQTTANTGDTVIIVWDVPVPVPVEFEYEVMESLQYPPSNYVSTTYDSLLFDGLDPSRDYYLFIRSSCGAGDVSPWVVFPFTTVPLNDECVDAITLEPDIVFDCSDHRYSTVGATDSGINPDSCGGVPDDDVWFAFTATARSHRIFIRPLFYESRPGSRTPTSGEAYTMELYADSCGGVFMHCISIPSFSQGESIIRTDLEIGSTYYVRVYGTYEYVGGSEFDICIGTIPPEPNDDCSTATLLVSNDSICENYAIANLAGSSPSGSPASSCDGAPYYDLWYKFVAIDTTQIIEVLFSNESDGVIQAFTGECSNFTELGCINDTIPGIEVMVLQGLVVGDTVFVRIFDAAGAGTFIETSICVHVPHINDACEGAIHISTVGGVTFSDPVQGNTRSATGSGGCSGFFADDDLWYSFTAVADTHLIVVLPYGYPQQISWPVIEWYADGCNSPAAGCSDTGDLRAANLTPGNEYYFRVYSAASYEGQGEFLLSITIPPANYSCAEPVFININESISCVDTVVGSTLGAGIDNAVWYAFVATDSSIVARANYLSGDASHYINFFDSCGGMPLVDEYQFSEVYYQHFAVGDTYYIRISSPVIDTHFYQGSFSLCLSDNDHDECAAARNIIPGNFCENAIEDSFLGATPSVSTDSCFSGGNDLWYQFTATAVFHEVSITTPEGMVVATGEVYRDSCDGAIVQCFTHNVYYLNTTNIYLHDLVPGNVYFIRVRNVTSFDSVFTVCVSTPPPNDDCSQPIVLTHAPTTHCNIHSTALGTTINGTHPEAGAPNVWYAFTATSTRVAIRVFPSTPGFDPKIRLWKKSAGGGDGDFFCITGSVLKSTDLTHASGQPEVMVYFGLTRDAEYLVEITDGAESINPGDFQICLATLSSAMTVHSADYETYDFDTVAIAGKWHQPVTKITLRMSGTTNNKRLTKVVVNTSGTTATSDLLAAWLYVDTTLVTVLDDPIDDLFPFDVFGQPPSPFGGPRPLYLFGQGKPNPNGTLTFTGNLILKGDANINYNRFLYLVYDIRCDADTGHIVKGHCTSVSVSGEVYTPFQRQNEGLQVAQQDRYDTRNDGHWANGNTWMCGSSPPDGPDIEPIHINHHVVVGDTQQTSHLKINYTRSLAMQPGTVFTLGQGSMGSASGHSNAYFDCKWGTVFLDSTQLHINGKILVGDFNHPEAGGISAINSTLIVDGNDGTAAGSVQGIPFNFNIPTLFDSAFHIHILDPAYGDDNDFVYWGDAFNGERLHGSVTFGGGDDTHLASNEDGFRIAWGAGTFLRPDSLIIRGGMHAEKRHVHGVVYAHHMHVDSNSEFVGTIILDGDLTNDGVITVPQSHELAFCGEADGANYYTNTTHGQSLTGLGYFRPGTTFPIPTSQDENQINKLQTANTFDGVTFTMPLGIKNILRIRAGKINTTDTSLLTLGDSLFPGALVSVDPDYPADPWKFYEVPYTGGVTDWNGGFVNGPFRRWFRDSTSTDTYVWPVGKGEASYPVGITSTSLDTGFITAQFYDENPGPSGMPLINEQGVDLNNVSPTGYWHIAASGIDTEYDLTVRATDFTLDEDSIITDLSNLRLIKRPDNGPWQLSGSSNTVEPLSLDSVSITGISGFSDFAIGLNCNRIVTTGADGVPGSLRYILEHCALPGDTIKFARNVDLVLVSIDTIVLEEDVSLFDNSVERVVIRSDGEHSVFVIREGVEVHFRTLDMETGPGVEGRAVLNDGVLILEDVIVRDAQTGGSVLYNRGTLDVRGITEVRSE